MRFNWHHNMYFVNLCIQKKFCTKHGSNMAPNTVQFFPWDIRSFWWLTFFSNNFSRISVLIKSLFSWFFELNKTNTKFFLFVCSLDGYDINMNKFTPLNWFANYLKWLKIHGSIIICRQLTDNDIHTIEKDAFQDLISLERL